MASELLLTTQGQNTQQISCCMWDYENGNILQVYKNGGSVTMKTLDVMGTDYIITAEQTKPLLHIWPMNSQEQLKSVRLVLPEPANALAVSPQNTYLALGINSKLYIWELCSGKLLSVQQIHYQSISCIKFSNTGSLLVITGKDGMIVTYNFIDLISKNQNKAQSQLGQIEPLYKRMDHSLPITDLYLGKFSYKSRFVTVSLDQSLRLYTLLDGELIQTLIFETPLTCVILDSPCFNLYVGDTAGVISKFILSNPPRTLEHHVDDLYLKQKLSYIGHKDKITCIDVNIYNNRLASGCEDNNVFIWDINTRQILRKIELKGPVTNLLFILTSEAMFSQNYKQTVVLSSLERNLEFESDDKPISVMQCDDLCLRGRGISQRTLEIAETVQDLQAQVVNLQKVNAQLFVQLQKCKNKT